MYIRILRRISVFMLTFLLLFTIIGCNQQGNSEQSIGNANNSQGQTDLTFYMLGKEKPDAKLVFDEIGKRAKSLNVKLNFNWIENVQFYGTLRDALNGNSSVDAFCVSDPGWISRLAGRNSIKDLTKLLPKYAPTLYSKYTKEDLKAASVNGKNYFVPNLYPSANAVYAVVREDLMKKYNIPLVKTYDDYEFYLKTVNENQVDKSSGTGALLGNTFDLFTGANGYTILDNEKQLVYKSDDSKMKIQAWELTPEFKKSVQYINSLKSKGYLSPYSFIRSYGFEDIQNEFLNGSFNSCIINERLLTKPIESLVFSINLMLKSSDHPDREIKVYQLYPEKDVQRLSACDILGDMGIGIPEKSPHAKQVLMFLDWLQSSQENYDLFMYGISGKHYNPVGNDKYSLPEGVTLNDNPYLGWNGSEAFLNFEYERFPVAINGDVKDSRRSFITKNTFYPKHLGFYPDYKPVLKESVRRNMKIGDIDGMVSTGKLVTEKDFNGLQDDDTIKITNEIQKQLDKWKKKDK
jgi:putative aldouronate transport system substrate-binding protein